LLKKQKSFYCEWTERNIYNQKPYEAFSMNFIHEHMDHWDFGINNEEALKIVDYMNRATFENVLIETFSLVLVGEMNLTDKTIRSALNCIKNLKSRNIKHFKIHLEGFLFYFYF